MLDRRTFAGLLGAVALPGTAQAKTNLPFYAATGPNLALYHLDTDAGAVVTSGLRVRGIQRLRVVDASIMPTIVSGNTNSPTVMIAERGAALIKGG